MSLDRFEVLSRYFASLFGAKDILGLKDLQAVENYPGSGGQTSFLPNLAGRVTHLGLQADLPTYDERLAAYEDQLRTARSEFVSFKYYQYLALLFTEVVLDRLTRDATSFVDELNTYLKKQQDESSLDKRIPPFAQSDLRRLAFYLATGAGKTLLVHVHFWQVQHYLAHGVHPEGLAPSGEFGRVLLLAPNPGLAEQHLRELQQSGIRAQLLSKVKNSLSSPSLFRATVLVTDMFKLRSERPKNPKQAETLYYKDFGQSNLVFVDEGHKGSATSDSAWRKIREWLSDGGMLFEYSATFAQVLRDDRARIEYGKRILSDYQYRYFYRDGYGKEFSTVNVEPSTTPDVDEQATLMGGLLTFFQQQLLFDRTRLEPYNVEKPLWVFVGHTVTKTKDDDERLGEDSDTLTDVAKVVRFVRFFLSEPVDAKQLAWNVLHDDDVIGAVNPFKAQLGPLRAQIAGSDALYDEIAGRIFGGRGALVVRELGDKAPGELSLSSTGSSSPFGLINIGDTAKFKKLMESRFGIPIDADPLGESLFHRLDQRSSTVNLLIGSRKFIEGWSSWRVSTMTLLYLGQGEGPQIIQLFGRGIRLKGRGHSLRRSSGTPGTPPELEQLETLYIFGLKADYMTKFLEAIDAEEGRLEEIEFPLDVPEGLRLPAPSLPDEQRFEASLASLTLPLENDAAYGPVLDMGPRVFERAGTEMELVSQGEEQRFQDHHLASIDWLRVVRKVEAFQRASNSSNVSWRGHALRSVLKSGHYTLFATNDQMEDVTFLEQAIVAVLKKYIENFHRAQLNSRQSEAMGVVQLDPRTVTRPYVVSLTRDHALLLDIKTLRDDITKWRSKGNSPLPRLYIAPELFTVVNQPLVHEDGLAADVAVSPVPLNSGERAFVEHLEQHWQKEHALHPDVELYLLRNLSASGLGFHAQTGFYPDFILWIKNAGEWRAVFIEPHGMRHEEPVKKNSKLSVFTRLLPSLNSKREFTDANLSLDGFVISQTNGPDIPGVEEIRNKWSRPDEWERLAEHHRLLVPENESQHISLILDL